jgi:XTP/dITP diphosphohydrolase
MKLVFATTNPHKLEEIATLLAPSGLSVVGLDSVAADVPAPPEEADTFEGNAREKATAYARALGVPCLADDSGLEVDALGGAPGVRSARYAGVEGTREERDHANRERLIFELTKLGDVSRRARLVCALCLCGSTGEVLFEARGTLEGTIVDEARGQHGFGYDVHLYLPAVGRTAAELPPKEMNKRSHRAEAARKLLAWLVEHASALK